MAGSATSAFDYDLTDRYRRSDGTVLLTGMQALARIPIEQLRRDRRAGHDTAAFVSGYPGSPLGGFDQEMARAVRLTPDHRIVHQPAVNEELGATGVMGSQLAPGRPDATVDGVVGVWYGKAPGLDRAGDALRHAVFAGTSPLGGAVALVGDDPACKSSTMPSSSDATLVDLHMPILYPGTTAECVELGLHAISMSRATGLWSAMKIVTPVADGSGTVALPVLDADPILPTVEIDGTRWSSEPSARFLGPTMLEVEREFREVRLPLAHRYGIENRLNRVSIDPADAWIGIVSTGFTYYEMLDALRRLGLDDEAAIAAAGIRLLQLRMPVPFDADLVRHFARGLDEIMVIEEKNPTLEWLIKDALYGRADQPRIVGKSHDDGRPLMRSWGMLDADAIVGGLRERLEVRLASRLAPEAGAAVSALGEKPLIPLSINRTPFFCSGCPHNWGTKVPDDALVGAGTGCHGMTLLMDPERVGEGIGITAMGNEGAQWIGMEPFVEADHLFQNYGDGTFFHSAQLALQYCIGAGKHMTFKILYNSTVAMTGGQDSPFAMDVPELASVLLAQGVTKVAVTAEDTDRYRTVSLPAGVDVHDRRRIVEVQEELRSYPGVTVLIHDQACAAELRRDRRRGRAPTPRRRVVINHRICEGCGDCGDVSNCLSVQSIDTPLGRKTAIDQASCNFDYSCLEGDCPAFMTVDLADDNTAGEADESPASGPEIGPLPTPPSSDGVDQCRIRLAGIGGTGVVTVAQVLETAAMLDGWAVRGVDQTGLSQKAGPVLSDVVLVRGDKLGSNVIGAGQADLLLGFDELVAAGDAALRAAASEATVTIASTHRTPTGAMISQPDRAYPAAAVAARLAESSVAEANRFADATRLASALAGGAVQANILLLGIAVQTGHIPVSPAAIEYAIELNGTSVDANLAAFGWGRAWADDPERVERIAVERAAAPTSAARPGPTLTVPDLPRSLRDRVAELGSAELRAVVEMLVADLVAYQDEDYAARYLRAVEDAVGHEQRVAAGSTALGEAVARSLHKLLAYKDEYEVARLMLLPEARAAVAAVGGPDATFAWRLHPPVLKAVGLRSKMAFEARTAPLFATLRAGKRLRGTRFDPFGRTTLRRAERALPGEYLAGMAEVYRLLAAENLDQAVHIAALPDEIRGYEELKLARIARYRSKVADQLADYRRDAIQPVGR